ncbi:fimbrial protein [Serratia ureilytica]|nr:fimbrial protein [Serratia ureilytica]MBF8244681.1 fimbrial protein [Serratia ureilytica]
MKRSRLALLLLPFIGGMIAQATAAENMRFSGTLIAPPPCTINNGQMVDVDFGQRVGVKKVDGKNYLQEVKYEIKCEDGISGLVLGLTVIGTPAGFDDAALKTDITDLGIRILRDGQPFKLNQRIAIDAENLPVLQAVPVKKPGVELNTGAFVALATLLADYQ